VIGGQSLTANIVTMSVFGAILMYIISMASLFKLRRSEPKLNRPYRAPFYPFFPAFALFAASIAMIAMIYYNFLIFVIFAVMLAIGYGYFLTTEKRRDAAPLDALIESTDELKAEKI
jgi:ethanolamine permease